MNDISGKAKELFSPLYDMYADAIFRFCFFKTGDREIAKDLTQDVFVKVFNHLKKGEQIREEKAFIYMIAKNTVIDYWRKKKSVSEGDLPEGFMENVSSSYKTDTLAEYNIFLSLLNKLSPVEREVIILRYVEDLSSKDMAHILGERENTVLVRLSRATAKLKAFAGETIT